MATEFLVEFAKSPGIESFEKLLREEGESDEWTLWELYRAYPCIAQGNVQPS